MKYRDILGFPKKKKILKEQLKPKKNSILDDIKQELNEWSHQPPSEKRWSGAYTRKDGLTEFEAKGGKDTVKLTEARETIFDVAKRVLDDKQNEKWKGVRIDLQTANLINTVHGKLDSKQKKII